MSRFQERYDEFHKAVKKLEEVFAEPYNEYVRDASIKRFEFTYELSWKTLKHYLSTKNIDVRNAVDTIKEGYSQGLIESSAADTWRECHQFRKLTSHTYDEVLAEDVYSFIKHKGLPLFQSLDEFLSKIPK